MLPLLAAAAPIIAGGLSYLGQSEANRVNQESAANATRVSQQESAANRTFQAEMSSTSHQREVEDLRKAGLNPILSANGGGSSTPSGSAATGQAAQVENAAGAGLASAVEAANLAQRIEYQGAQLKNMDEQNKNLRAERRNTDMDTYVKGRLAPVANLGSRASKWIDSVFTKGEEAFRANTRDQESAQEKTERLKKQALDAVEAQKNRRFNQLKKERDEMRWSMP